MAEALRWFWLNLPDAPAAPCGAVACNSDGMIVGGAHIFVRRMRGRLLNDVVRAQRNAGRRAEWKALADG